MKVKDLIEELKKCDPEAIVEVKNSNDEWDYIWHVFDNSSAGKVRLLP